ncbi:unnamed protein product [Diamesa serratosioi]
MILLTITTCSYQIYKIFAKWNKYPVIVTFDTKSTPIWEIPFPAVTICPQAKSNHTLFNLTHFIEKDEYYNIERRTFFALGHVCNFDADLFDQFPEFKVDTTVLKDLKRISIQLQRVISNFKFTGISKNNENEFYDMFTNEGICFSFNLLTYNQFFNENIEKSQKMPQHGRRYEYITSWSLEGGYKDTSVDIYPYRAMISGVKAGLSFNLLTLAADIDASCGLNVNGFKIALHTPGEFPRFEKHFYQIPFGQYVMISVKPKVITTSKSLKIYSPKKRQCYFDGEMPLEFFKMYTQSNCELECLTKFTQSTCGCVKFSMPHNNETMECTTAEQIKCYQITQDLFDVLNFKDNFKKDDENNEQNKGSDFNRFDEHLGSILDESYYERVRENLELRQCNCLPACTSIQYDAEISQNVLHKPQYKYLKSSVNIYFKEEYFIAMHRSELYGWIDFIASCGGVVGLFMGFSILSVIETVYSILMFKIKKNKLPEKTLDKPNVRIVNVSTIPEKWKNLSRIKYLP